jgi:choline-sulfatase
MRRYEALANPYTLSYVAYRYYQHRGEWPTVHGERVASAHAADITGSTEPFFAWTHLMDLHAPISPRAIRRGGLAASDRPLRHLLSDAARVGNVHEPMYDTLYDSTLRYVDECVGELIATLQEQGCWENTVLVVTSDHGEVLFDRGGIYGHPRHHLYDELLHVPLLVRTPDDDRRRIDRPFSLAWMHELLSEIIDIETGDFPAVSGSESILHGSSDESNVVVSDSLDESGHSLAVRNEQNKLLAHVGSREADRSEYRYFDRDTAFQYVSDRGERVPIDPETVPELETSVHDLTVDPDTHPTIEGGFDPATEQRLRDLGYRM